MASKKLDKKLLESFLSKANWYHTIKYNDSKTNGIYDHEEHVHEYGFDESYKDRSILEVGPSDGFFSFLFKKRGAKIVTAIDANTYDGAVTVDVSNKGKKNYQKKYSIYKKEYDDFKTIFNYYGIKNSNKMLVLSKLLSLKVNYLTGSIYNLSKIKKHDVVFCGDLLEHLRDPITAIEQLYYKTNHKCIITVSSALNSSIKNFFIGDSFLKYTGHHGGGNFYNLSYSAVRNMCLAAGFREVLLINKFNIINKRHGTVNKHFVLHALK